MFEVMFYVNGNSQKFLLCVKKIGFERLSFVCLKFFKKKILSIYYDFGISEIWFIYFRFQGIVINIERGIYIEVIF